MLPAPLLQPVIARGGAQTLRTLAAYALVWLQPNVDRLWPPLVSAQFDFLVNKPSKVLNSVQKSLKLKLNSWSPFFVWFVVGKLRLNRNQGDQLLGYVISLLVPSFTF
jgi:hypothetical protein